MGALSIWMNGEMVGTWSVRRTGHHRLDYAPSWRASARSRPLSLSLPFTADNRLEGDVVRNYFDNLLPDSDDIRKRISARFRTKSTDVFSLLQAVGRDCVGAVQLLPPGVTPEGFDALRYETLTSEQIEKHLGTLGSEVGVGAQDDEEAWRLSIAGAQEKTALLQVNGQWCRPLGATPTTHILKPPIGVTTGRNLDLRLSVENEWLCNQIVRELGLPAAECQIQDFGARRALVVKRFDRSWYPEGWIARLPQEDFCQAKGVASDQKYEQKGGPSIEACLEVLKGGEAFHEDGQNFLCAQLLFWFLAAIDGHAKNFSLFVLPGGRYRMTLVRRALGMAADRHRPTRPAVQENQVGNGRAQQDGTLQTVRNPVSPLGNAGQTQRRGRSLECHAGHDAAFGRGACRHRAALASRLPYGIGAHCISGRAPTPGAVQSGTLAGRRGS